MITADTICWKESFLIQHSPRSRWKYHLIVPELIMFAQQKNFYFLFKFWDDIIITFHTLLTILSFIYWYIKTEIIQGNVLFILSKILMSLKKLWRTFSFCNVEAYDRPTIYLPTRSLTSASRSSSTFSLYSEI